jgi:hypothetical protein
MNDQSRHEMILETTHASGAEEWYCPTCGRRMTITWQPWKKIVLEPGDIYAAHGGSKGILKIGALQINPVNGRDPASTEPYSEDPYLAPWVRWLDETDWDDLWNHEDTP